MIDIKAIVNKKRLGGKLVQISSGIFMIYCIGVL